MNTKISVYGLKKILSRLSLAEKNAIEDIDEYYKLIHGYECLDRVAKRTGLNEPGYSFFEIDCSDVELDGQNKQKIFNRTLLEHCSKSLQNASRNFRQNAIDVVDNWRNRWTQRVLTVELSIYLVIAVITYGALRISHLLEGNQLAELVTSLLYDRPVFSFFIVFVIVSFMIFFHIRTRRMVSAQLLDTLEYRPSDFNLVKSFLKNTTGCVSLFKPELVGLNRKDLQLIKLLSDK